MLEGDLIGNFILAPLAGITDIAFRRICSEQGADLVFTEMVSCDGLIYNFQKTSEYLKTYEKENKIGVQLFGHKVENIQKAIEILNQYDFFCIDFNAGCPVKKVTRHGNGAALLKDPAHLEKIMTTIKSTSNHPVSLKVRKGYYKNDDITPRLVDMANDLDLAFLTIHGRTKAEMFSGISDWSVIKEAAVRSKIPIVGNGDIFSYSDYEEKAFSQGIKRVMIGRGCLGNPFLFKELKNKGSISITNKEKMETGLKHFSYLLQEKPEKRAVFEMRKHWAWYSKGMNNGSLFRKEIFIIEKVDQVIETVKKFIDKIQ